MNIEYNYDNNPQNIPYILCLLVFVSTFFISIKLIGLNILFSLLVYMILTIATGIYLINIERYSLYKYDVLTFNGIFFCFSIAFFITLANAVWNSNPEYNVMSVLLIILFVSIYNHIISVIKICHSNILNKYKSILIFICYSYILAVTVMLFSNIYIIQSNLSVKNYLKENFIYEQQTKLYTEIDKSIEPNTLLTYNPKSNLNITYNTFNENQLQNYLFSRYRPLNKLEDYIFYSVQNTINGSYGEVTVKGKVLKYISILQKYLFLASTFFTVICLIEGSRQYQISKK